jgi:hypothetical protein
MGYLQYCRLMGKLSFFEALDLGPCLFAFLASGSVRWVAAPNVSRFVLPKVMGEQAFRTSIY